MKINAVRQKAVCYILREGHLLVLRHLGRPWEDAGLQVPAGTVAADETPQTAALREAGEETGLHGVRLVRKLGEMHYDMRPHRFETQHRHVFHLTVDAEPPRRWTSQESDPETGDGPIDLECFWLPLELGHTLAAGQGALLGRLLD